MNVDPVAQHLRNEIRRAHALVHARKAYGTAAAYVYPTGTLAGGVIWQCLDGHGEPLGSFHDSRVPR